MRVRVGIFLVVIGLLTMLGMILLDYSGGNLFASVGKVQLIGAGLGLMVMIAGGLVLGEILKIPASVPDYADVVAVVTLLMMLGLLEGAVRILNLDADAIRYGDMRTYRANYEPQPMWPPNIAQAYNTVGVYEGGGQTWLRTDDYGMILPSSEEAATYRVLFLGGSTTEALYVPQEQRWVALLNQPGKIATYNAAQSGTNTLDAYMVYRYLTEDAGLQFDLVVLMTTNNDMGWQIIFAEYDYPFLSESYAEGFQVYLAAEEAANPTDDESEGASLGRTIRSVQVIRRAIDVIVGDAPGDSNPASAYRRQVAGNQDRVERYGLQPLAACDQAVLDDYERYSIANLSLLADAVHDQGSDLLILTEASSFGAPSDSFYEDFRVMPTCDVNTYISLEDAETWFAEIQARRLHVADESGVEAFDLAFAMSPFVNGPEGGRYMYDSVHYTPLGSMEVANQLRPVIEEMLNRLDH